MKWIQYSEKIWFSKTNQAHLLAETIRKNQFTEIEEVISSDTEIALKFSFTVLDDFFEKIENLKITQHLPNEIFKIPVCYELGLDWDRVEVLIGLKREEIIRKHLNNQYLSSYGFTPGFLYMVGLLPELACDRLNVPRRKVPTGSVGIGGNKTGIYSLETPGGWNIIGRTPLALFDITCENPMVVPNLSIISFQRISQEQFMQWN